MKTFDEITKNDVIDATKTVCKGIFGVAKFFYDIGEIAGESKTEHVSDEEAVLKYNGYGKAIHAISNSDMLSSYKEEAIKYVPENKPDEFYQAVASIATSDMCSSSKVSAIKNMCKSNSLFD